MRERVWNAGKGLLAAGLLFSSVRLLGEDAGAFLKWWLMAALMGIGCYPLISVLFRKFADCGWMVSRVLGIAAAGFVTWAASVAGILPFSAPGCLTGALIVLAISWGGFFLWKRKRPGGFHCPKLSAVLGEEVIFLLFFLFWTYVSGFRPEAYGTEKYMDYGFMMAMMRSETLPAKDIWFGTETINYYYGGQYYAVYLTKLSGTCVEETYHLMKALVAAFAYVLPFTLVRQMLLDYGKAGKGPAALGGLLAGAGVSLAGNMHYVLVGKLLPWIRDLWNLPEGDYTYWFPNSTRYIGYYPEGNDKTIHEFPSYSFVLGDLHAHVVNVMFVLALICVIYAMIQNSGEPSAGNGKQVSRKRAVKEALTDPYVWLLGIFTGIFHWTNYWDFVIYYVFGGLGVIYCNYLKYGKRGFPAGIRLWTAVSVLHAGFVWLLGTVVALPFTLHFETMVNGIALAANHSRPYQWWLIWGLPFLVTVLFVICVFRDRTKGEALPPESDFFGVIMGFSAVGLILIPELVYVRDIYEKEYARSNTMFKLTYQAFILFGLVMGYAFVRLWLKRRSLAVKGLLTVGTICFAGCCCYVGTAVHAWFGQIWDPGQYQGLDATAFLESRYPEDAAAIRWLNEHVDGQPLVLEASGDSYSDDERVSAMTGLPTVVGWYVHEWLWRGDIEELNLRVAQVESIYTASGPEEARQLIEQLQVDYIFVGSREREKYPELNEVTLQQLGQVVFRDENSGTYIVKTGLQF